MGVLKDKRGSEKQPSIAIQNNDSMTNAPMRTNTMHPSTPLLHTLSTEIKKILSYSLK